MYACLCVYDLPFPPLTRFAPVLDPNQRWASYIARQPIAVASTLLLLADDVCNTMWPAESPLADTFGQERPDASSSPWANFWDAHSFVMRVATVI